MCPLQVGSPFLVAKPADLFWERKYVHFHDYAFGSLLLSSNRMISRVDGFGAIGGDDRAQELGSACYWAKGMRSFTRRINVTTVTN